MTITRIEIYRYTIKMEPFAIATGVMQAAQNVFLKVFTNAGLWGGGECSAFPFIVGETQETCLAMAKDFARLWIGKSAADIPERMQELDAFTARNYTIKSAFDMALYDLAAKSVNMPLYQYLNGSKKSIETDITIGIGPTTVMVEKALEYQQQGANLLKVKIGKNAYDDVEKIKAIRQAIQPQIKIRVDANQGWEFEDALFALQSLNECDVEFCEQPMPTWCDDYLPELCHNTPIDIMADESCYNYHDARRLIKSASCHSINIKLAKSGGILGAKKIHDVAAEAGVPCMLGGMLESRFALTANVHLALAGANILYYDLDTCKLGHLEDPVINGVNYTGFVLNIDDSPGIGADIDEAFLQKCDRIVII